MIISEMGTSCMQRAIQLAMEAGKQGNLPIGAVISHKGEIIAEGKNSIWSPEVSLAKHAEMEALSQLPEKLIQHTAEMTLYTTLEPCVMCLGAILLHRIGRVIYGSADSYGGAGALIKQLPPYFQEQFAEMAWIGPAFPKECDVLYEQVKELENLRAKHTS